MPLWQRLRRTSSAEPEWCGSPCRKAKLVHELGLYSAQSLRIVGFHGECQWSDGLAKLPTTLADAQVARWQSKYERDPTDQQRSWLVNKIRTDIAMMRIKLNAQVIIKNLQNMHEKSLPPRGARKRMELEYQEWARLQGKGPHTGGRNERLVGWRMW